MKDQRRRDVSCLRAAARSVTGSVSGSLVSAAAALQNAMKSPACLVRSWVKLATKPDLTCAIARQTGDIGYLAHREPRPEVQFGRGSSAAEGDGRLALGDEDAI
jgi:hypothetical protein